MEVGDLVLVLKPGCKRKAIAWARIVGFTPKRVQIARQAYLKAAYVGILVGWTTVPISWRRTSVSRSRLRVPTKKELAGLLAEKLQGTPR